MRLPGPCVIAAGSVGQLGLCHTCVLAEREDRASRQSLYSVSLAAACWFLACQVLVTLKQERVFCCLFVGLFHVGLVLRLSSTV